MAADNGFKIVQFSPELIQALTQMGELRTRINDYAVEEFKNYKGEEKLDHRDFVEMMNLSPEKSEKEQKEYVRNFVRDYTSGDPQLRKMISMTGMTALIPPVWICPASRARTPAPGSREGLPAVKKIL